MPIVPDVILHLMTQDNQPYGSRRKCCEICGVMIQGPDAYEFHNNREEFNTLPLSPGYVKCDGQLPWERAAELLSIATNSEEARRAVLVRWLGQAWAKQPEQRLGQFLVNTLPGHRPSPLFNLSDEDFGDYLDGTKTVEPTEDSSKYTEAEMHAEAKMIAFGMVMDLVGKQTGELRESLVKLAKSLKEPV